MPDRSRHMLTLTHVGVFVHKYIKQLLVFN